MLRTSLQAAADQATVADNALRAEFKSDFNNLREQITNTLGDALTQINVKVMEVDQAQKRLDTAGVNILEKMDG